MLPFEELSTSNPTKLYIYYSIPILVFLLNIGFLKIFPQFFDWSHTIVALILHGLIAWRLIDRDITTFSSFSEFYKGFIIANIYVFLYISARFLTKIFIILAINISAIFLFPNHTNGWIIAIAQTFLMLLLVIKSHNEDSIKRELFFRTRKQNLWESIIEDFLPISLFVVKLDKITQRIEFVQANKCAKKKLKIHSDDELQRFLDSTRIEIQENSSNNFLQGNTYAQNKDFGAGFLEKQLLQTHRQVAFDDNRESGNLVSPKPPLHFILPKGKFGSQPAALNLQSQRSGVASPRNHGKQGTNSHSAQDLTNSGSVNFGSLNSQQKNSRQKVSLKALLKSKLLKEAETKEQTQQYNSYQDDFEVFVGNWIEKKEEIAKKLNIKIFCFPLLENYAVVTIENESAKSKLKKQEKKNEFRANFWKKITYRVEAATCQLVKKLSNQVKVIGKVDATLSKKIKEILQIGYQLLILTRNANDYLPEQESNQNQNKTNHTNLANSMGINFNLQQQSNYLGIPAMNGSQINVNGSEGLQQSQIEMGNSQLITYGAESVMISTNFHGKQTFANNSKNKHTLEVLTFSPLKELNAWLSVLDARIQSKKLEVVTDVSKNLQNIANDKDKFNRILYNVLDNAVKYSPIYGKLMITMEYNNTTPETLEIHVINNLNSECDSILLSKDLDQCITGDQLVDPSSNQHELRLGIPVSKKLLSIIGPYDYFKHTVSTEQLDLMFSVFTDVEILKPMQQPQQDQTKKKMISHAQSSFLSKSYLVSARNSQVSSGFMYQNDWIFPRTTENLDQSTVKNSLVRFTAPQNVTNASRKVMISQSNSFLVGGGAGEEDQDEMNEEIEEEASHNQDNLSEEQFSKQLKLLQLNKIQKISSSTREGNSLLNTPNPSFQYFGEPKQKQEDLSLKSDALLAKDIPIRKISQTIFLTSKNSNNNNTNNTHKHNLISQPHFTELAPSDEELKQVKGIQTQAKQQQIIGEGTAESNFDSSSGLVSMAKAKNHQNQQNFLTPNFQSHYSPSPSLIDFNLENMSTSRLLLRGAFHSGIKKIDSVENHNNLMEQTIQSKSSSGEEKQIIGDNKSSDNSGRSQIQPESQECIPDEKKEQQWNLNSNRQLTKPHQTADSISQINHQNLESEEGISNILQNSVQPLGNSLTAQHPYLSCVTDKEAFSQLNYQGNHLIPKKLYNKQRSNQLSPSKLPVNRKSSRSDSQPNQQQSYYQQDQEVESQNQGSSDASNGIDEQGPDSFKKTTDFAILQKYGMADFQTIFQPFQHSKTTREYPDTSDPSHKQYQTSTNSTSLSR